MRKNFERDLINYFLSSGHYRVYELAETNEGETIWMIQGSQGQVDEIAIFTEPRNFNFARDKFEQYLNSSYVGNKGVAVSFIVSGTIHDDMVEKDHSVINSRFIVSTALVQIDVDSYKVADYMGISNVLQGVLTYLQYKQKQMLASPKSKLTVTNGLIVINVIMYIITAIASKNIFNIDITTLLNFGAKYSPLIDLGEYYRLVTAMFLHGGLLHIALNMYSLRMIGTLIEKIYGNGKFILIYFMSGIFGSVFSYVFSSPASVGVGASGAIFGLMGASVVYGIRMRKKIGRDFLSHFFQVIVANLFLGFTISNIDNAAHIGGLLGGLLITAAIEASRKTE
ncbi:rhomboid family intramembrane serine protease [Clostridium thermarum]|uniref:rhomboid family intramembrane serine protease n=1 Tax=Clostridium thermarum TaxID=1716543 RepID=UPI001124AB6F|nr:rhomboid family intramembrane serine protease [Clostridium thermarum]